MRATRRQPVREQARVKRRGSRFVLAARPGSPPLADEAVRQTLEAIREERSRKILVAPPGLEIREP